MRVQVYWNLRKKCWSVVALEGDEKGRVVSHTDKVLIEDATFAVQPAGNARVRREGRKNVHAFVRGIWRSRTWPPTTERMLRAMGPSGRGVMYNPYKYETFVFSDNEEPVFSAKSVALLGRYNVVAEVVPDAEEYDRSLKS